ncbi:hypothetical protein PENNAL_c0007G05972 [Penicillium nalgiovense]|uniref:NodB homology domain-containing protein n=1 Tax=Penicillium nalgiovense TaxID=60175 RepID=A0A1V6YY90_PENNA|nr:hypothetical protein PENNAL_c0007G05972 [Penicillium nalgiovense]
MAATRLFTIEQCIAENIPLSAGYRDFEVEKEQIEKNIEAIREISSQPPRGWYVGLPSMSSKGLVCHVFEQQGLELLFQCDSYSDELPYWTAYPLGLSKGLLMIPYTYDVNENKFTTSPSFTNPRDWLEYCKAAFDVLYEEDCNGEPKMMTIGLHSRLIGRPARFQALRELVKYIQGREGVWAATREEIARHWIKTHPFNESKLNRIRYFL